MDNAYNLIVIIFAAFICFQVAPKVFLRSLVGEKLFSSYKPSSNFSKNTLNLFSRVCNEFVESLLDPHDPFHNFLFSCLCFEMWAAKLLDSLGHGPTTYNIGKYLPFYVFLSFIIFIFYFFKYLHQKLHVQSF